MLSLRPKTQFILPLIMGLALLWALPRWKPLAQIEHRLFLFPERFEPETIFPDRHNLQDFKITPLHFGGQATPLPLSSYLIDQETRDIIDLSPEKWAYFLQVIREKNEGPLIITAPLSWQDATELSLQTLDHQIAKTPQLVIGLDAEFNNTSAPLPHFLKSSLLSERSPPFLNLPQIDFLTHPPSVKASLFGVSTIQGLIIENESTQLKVPMLVSWDGAVLPSTHLAAILASLDLTAQEVIIAPAGYLRLGSEGPIIKIDSRGRAYFPDWGNATRSASQILISPEKNSSGKILILPDSPKHIRLLETHLTQALAQIPKPRKTYRRWPFPLEAAILIGFTFLLQARRLSIILLSIAAILFISTLLKHWFPCTPLALILSAFALIPKSTAKQAPPEQAEKAPASPPEKKSVKAPEPPQTTKKSPKKSTQKIAKKAPRKHPTRKKKKRR